eukprot:CAMPEP_0185794780 /NCGR_PEP_ID=MMETSP1174-20130828/160194_1 /TAXON_ID=35687 /ORGANISM="Dictyocha speculum, Strain CCMP1381" /LENGTH=62 /DNA_ID=CAMNT_0028490027 /DNA_START=436 /DNA_END=624 /DNA_ORIENTATION=+
MRLLGLFRRGKVTSLPGHIGVRFGYGMRTLSMCAHDLRFPGSFQDRGHKIRIQDVSDDAVGS